MNSILRPLFLATALLFGATAHAALNPAFVSAEARWIVHADLDALRATTLGQELVSAIEKAQADATGGTIGLDVARTLKTIGTLTAYGTNLTADPKAIDGALIASGTPELRKIVESALLQGTLAQPKIFAEDTSFPFPAYTISHAAPKGQPADQIQVIIVFPPEPVIIVGKSKAQLLKAQEVMRGAAPSLAKAPGSPLGRFVANAEGAHLFTASVVPADNVFPENAPQTRMLRLASAGSLALGERGENTFARAELLASSGANADKLAKILQGMVAALSLAETTDKQLAEFINSTSVTRTGDLVKLDLAYSSARLAAMAQSVRASMEKPAARTPAPPAPIVTGRTLAEWTATASTAPDSDPANSSVTRTIEDVELKNGSTITLGWRLNGGKGVRYQRVEITPAQGGAPLVFRSDMMQAGNNRGAQTARFSFPGADGVYALKITYANDPEGKAAYAVSVRDPRPAAPEKK
ncbi:MAG: hypothetical protein JNL39_11170 [Opitutaceae bacterium]|nr:hypothetical protein [Opitutaceae bacterium]